METFGRFLPAVLQSIETLAHNKKKIFLMKNAE
jgi:hypothetical protein